MNEFFKNTYLSMVLKQGGKYYERDSEVEITK